MGIIFNRKDQNIKRKLLRNAKPRAEVILWNRLKGRQVRNKKFRRQFSVGRYVIDFYCPECRIAIEVDGSSHNSPDSKEYDIIRQNEIENFRIVFLRFQNEDVIGNINEVISIIENKIDELAHKQTTPNPPPFQGGGF